MSALLGKDARTQEPTELLEMAERAYGHEEKARGAIFTKSTVVDFMLDLIGYTADKPLHLMRLLEPSFGGGQFVLHAADRLIEAWKRDNGADPQVLRDALRAVELEEKSFEDFGATLQDNLRQSGFSPADSKFLVDSWLRHEDFLLGAPLGEFDFVIGNPPYVRQELVPNDLLQLYREKYPTMVGRADLYIAFMERSLDLLSETGKLSFICADAWTRNNYGRGIRGKIAQNYALTHYIDMYGLDAFEVKVGAYPSITVIVRGDYTPTRVAHARNVDSHYLQTLSSELLTEHPVSSEVLLLDAVRDASPWLLSVSPTVSVIAGLESRFPTLIEAGCRVGIGVATGADRVYIDAFDNLDVEEDRKLPLATNKDLSNGIVMWGGKAVVNPWREEGGLVDLADYPRLAAYLEPFREQLSRRHTAKGDAERKWYKTIDKIEPSLVNTPKLLIPDIRGNGDAIGYDPGNLYPHHNLYFITSTKWDLRALQALLRSGIAHLFVAAYSVKIGGGYLRFQAQNLKRIRVPHWQEITTADQNEMHRAGEWGEKLPVALLERIYQLKAGTLAFLEEN